MKAYIKLKCILILVVIVFSSCKNENKTIILNFEAELSTANETSLIRDSIVIQYYSNDSILFLKYSNGDYKRSRYFNMNNVFFERRISVTEVGEFVGIDSILTFSKKDTVFEYKSARRFIPIVQDYSFADCIYSIKHKGDEYKTIKQSLVDSTYKEIFFYDKNYHIYKYVNTWKDNKCVYVKKE
jgi:hypothetical protein